MARSIEPTRVFEVSGPVALPSVHPLGAHLGEARHQSASRCLRCHRRNDSQGAVVVLPQFQALTLGVGARPPICLLEVRGPALQLEDDHHVDVALPSTRLSILLEFRSAPAPVSGQTDRYRAGRRGLKWASSYRRILLPALHHHRRPGIAIAGGERAVGASSALGTNIGAGFDDAVRAEGARSGRQGASDAARLLLTVIIDDTSYGAVGRAGRIWHWSIPPRAHGAGPLVDSRGVVSDAGGDTSSCRQFPALQLGDCGFKLCRRDRESDVLSR